MNENLTCVLCPRGCALTVEGEKDNLSVKGNFCPRGEKYGKEEILCPKRSVTFVVQVTNRPDHPVVPVKTLTPVKKEDILKVAEDLMQRKVQAPVRLGDVICENLYGSKIVATKTIL